MKSALAYRAVLGVSILLGASALTGCGGASAEMSGAEYPPPPEPIGYNGPQGVAASDAPQVAPQKDGVPAEVAQQYAPQADDLAIGESSSEYADTDPAALADFRQPLEPYGTWADDGQYGTVWTPAANVVGPEFSPYVTAGHWTYDNEYTWVSDYEWGWAPFHYGRWVYIGARGWSWIPGRTYSGAWVTWRAGYNDWGYVGWAPLPPTWYWRGGYAVGFGFVPVAPYVFCSNTYLFHPGVGGHIVTGNQVGVVASHTRPYVPANPVVGGNGHVAARPTVGPPPGQLGISAGSIPRAPQDNRGLTQAQQFASPTTARALGARPPQNYAQTVAAAPSAGAESRSYSAPARAFVGPAPRQSSPPSVSRGDAVASSPQYRGIAPTPYRAPAAISPTYSSPTPTPSPAPFSGAGPYRTPTATAPFSAQPSQPSQPTFRSAPTYSPPAQTRPTYSPPAQAFRPAAPSYSPPAQTFRQSTPSYSPPAQTFRSPPASQSFRQSAPAAPMQQYTPPRSGGFQGARRR